MFYALEPYILNFPLGLTCYLVVYAISALLFYNKILEIIMSVLGILAYTYMRCAVYLPQRGH